MTIMRQAQPMWFRIVAIVLVLWGLMGCYACLQQFRLGADAMGPASDYDRALYASLPVWYNAVYVVAVGCGLAAALGLLLRSVMAIPLSTISLAAIIIMFGWFFLATDVIARKGVWTIYFPLVIFALGAFQVWLARSARRRGWIG